MEWIDAGPLTELQVGLPRLVRHEGLEIALFRLDRNTVHAVDNRCPHEGYPLTQGSVRDGVLTCAWHNFKWQIGTGSCVKGDEDLPIHPVRVREGRIEVGLVPPDPVVEIPRRYASLHLGIRERRLGQITRDLARLVQLGVSPEALLLEAVRWDAEHAEWGTSHVAAVATDLLGYLPRYPGLDAVLVLVHAYDLLSNDHVRRPPRPTPEPVDPGPDPVAAGERLFTLVESEQAEAAEALFRGAVKRWGREVIEPWLLRLCAAHFLDFGHALIYQIKLFDLLEALGWEHADDVLPALLFKIVMGTREDLLPTWRGPMGTVPAVEELATFRGTGAADPEPILAGLRGAPGLWDTLHAQLKTATPQAILDVITQEAAEQLIYFDVEIDRRTDLQDTWLFATHRLTFCNAVRHALERWDDPERLRLVYQAAHFVRRGRKLVRRRPLPAPREGDALQAIAERRDHDVLALPRPGREALLDVAIGQSGVLPIVITHAIKTTLAAFEEYERTGDERFVQAALRFLAAPKVERSPHRTALEAVAFVGQGKIPRSLSG